MLPPVRLFMMALEVFWLETQSGLESLSAIHSLEGTFVQKSNHSIYVHPGWGLLPS